MLSMTLKVIMAVFTSNTPFTTGNISIRDARKNSVNIFLIIIKKTYLAIYSHFQHCDSYTLYSVCCVSRLPGV